MKEYNVTVTCTEQMLASSPCQKDVYNDWIIKKAKEHASVNMTDEKVKEELETLPDEKLEEKGWSVFHGDDKGLFLFEYHLRGFIKEAAQAVIGKGAVPAFKSKIDRWLFVSPRRLYLYGLDGEHILKPHGCLERPIRVMTMQGPRVSVKRSDYLDAGTGFTAKITVLPLGEKELTKEVISQCLDYGQYSGFGEWRTGGYGRFTYTLEDVV